MTKNLTPKTTLTTSTTLWNYTCLRIVKMQGVHYYPDKRCQEVFQVYPRQIRYQLAEAMYFISQTLPSNQEDSHPFGIPRQCKAEEGRNPEVIHQPF